MIYKKTAWVMVAAIMFVAVAASAQEMPIPRNEDRWKELQSMRVWTIIQQLDLDARSERGIAILGLINNNADKSRELLLEKQLKRRLLYTAVRDRTPNETTITTLIEEIEELHQKILQGQLTYQSELRDLLSPMERAKLYIAEDLFRQRLRRAMQGNKQGRKGFGQQRGNPPREPNPSPMQEQQ